jgi:hypothetical protein
MLSIGVIPNIGIYYGIRLVVVQPMMEQAKIAQQIEELRLKTAPLLPALAGLPGT